jgi:hypothetical protein
MDSSLTHGGAFAALRTFSRKRRQLRLQQMRCGFVDVNDSRQTTHWRTTANNVSNVILTDTYLVVAKFDRYSREERCCCPYFF